MRLVGYVRVSTVRGREGDSFISPSVQRDQIRRYAELRGYTVTEWIEDLDQSGAKADRPGFQRALELVETRQADGIACAKLDRFARSVVDGRDGLERLKTAGGTLVLVAEGLDTNTPMGKAMFTILLAFAELELDRIRDNWKVARERAIGRGVPASPHVRLGYRRNGDGQLEPDPAIAPAVREVFLRRAAGESWRNLCSFLDDQVKRAGGHTVTTVMAIIRSRVYLGELNHGDIVNRQAHTPLVTRAEWEAAQQAPLLAARRTVGSMLAGIVRCAGCGYTMSREAAGTRPYWYYGCRKLHAGGRCQAPAKISGPNIDAHVEEAFLDGLRVDAPAVTGEAAMEQTTVALAGLEAAEDELAAYRDANLVTVIGVDAYRDGLTQRAHTVDAARGELARLRREQPPTMPPAELLKKWPALSVDEKRLMLAAAIDAVFVKRTHSGRRGTPVADRARILFRGEGPDVLPGRGVAQLRPFLF